MQQRRDSEAQLNREYSPDRPARLGKTPQAVQVQQQLRRADLERQLERTQRADYEVQRDKKALLWANRYQGDPRDYRTSSSDKDQQPRPNLQQQSLQDARLAQQLHAELNFEAANPADQTDRQTWAQTAAPGFVKAARAKQHKSKNLAVKRAQRELDAADSTAESQQEHSPADPETARPRKRASPDHVSAEQQLDRELDNEPVAAAQPAVSANFAARHLPPAAASRPAAATPQPAAQLAAPARQTAVPANSAASGSSQTDGDFAIRPGVAVTELHHKEIRHIQKALTSVIYCTYDTYSECQDNEPAATNSQLISKLCAALIQTWQRPLSALSTWGSMQPSSLQAGEPSSAL